MSDVRVPDEWVHDAEQALDALYENEVNLSSVSVIFYDSDTYSEPAGFSLHFKRDEPFGEGDDQ